MITIKYNDTLERLAAELLMTPELVVRKLSKALEFSDEDDHYAGERLGRLLLEAPWRRLIIADTVLSLTPEVYDLTLWYEGAEIPCPLCGWEMAIEEEGNYIVGYKCPHCGHVQLELPPDA